MEFPFARSRMLQGLLVQEGFVPGRLHVATLMKRMRFEALSRKPNTSKPAPGHKIYPYLLRNLSITRPNHVWAMDITYSPMARGFIYLAVVVDWATRRVLARRITEAEKHLENARYLFRQIEPPLVTAKACRRPAGIARFANRTRLFAKWLAQAGGSQRSWFARTIRRKVKAMMETGKKMFAKSTLTAVGALSALLLTAGCVETTGGVAGLASPTATAVGRDNSSDTVSVALRPRSTGGQSVTLSGGLDYTCTGVLDDAPSPRGTELTRLNCTDGNNGTGTLVYDASGEPSQFVFARPGENAGSLRF